MASFNAVRGSPLSYFMLYLRLDPASHGRNADIKVFLYYSVLLPFPIVSGVGTTCFLSCCDKDLAIIFTTGAKDCKCCRDQRFNASSEALLLYYIMKERKKKHHLFRVLYKCTLKIAQQCLIKIPQNGCHSACATA
jgi:hypothetical protein